MGTKRQFLLLKHRVAPIGAPGPQAWTTAVCLSLETAEGLAELLLSAVRQARPDRVRCETGAGALRVPVGVNGHLSWPHG